MVRAWYMGDDTTVDQREPHQQDPTKPVELDFLKKLGVLYFKVEKAKPSSPTKDDGIGSEDYSNDPALLKIREDRGYTYEDMITCSPDKLPNYDDKLKMFFTEHIHEDEEIRLITDGSGYFDVRDTDDKWIRIELGAGDMIILPAGIYHRFTLDTKNYVQARRYFVGTPVWTPVNRPCDEHAIRKTYLATHAA